MKDNSRNTRMEEEAALTHQAVNRQLNEIAINYVDDLIADVKQLDLLRGLLASDERRDVVVFGESNFTFSMALASLRGSWDGITSTRYGHISHNRPKPVFSDLKVETSQYCIENGKGFGDGKDAILSKVKMVLNLPSPPDYTWKFGVDATGNDMDVQGKVVWFQCPWIAQTKEHLSKTTGELVAGFLKHMVDKQHSGDYALVGMVNKLPFVKDYKLQELLGTDLAWGHAHSYQFLGADKKFVRELMQYGYMHESCVSSHERLLDDHITLVFYNLGKIEINYADYKYAKVNQMDILRGLLAGEERRDVVVFGEGNFTFSMALACLRGSWDGITSTRYEPISHEHPEPQFSDVKVEASQYCIENGNVFGDASDAILSKATLVLQMRSPPRRDHTWKFGVDATNLPDYIDVQGKVAWFQCPWITREDEELGKTTDSLVASFLKHMVDKQRPGDYALVGIANEYPFVKDYKLHELLGADLARGHTHGYRFLGTDEKFVRELLLCGYRHEGDRDRHRRFINTHITLVFCRLN